MHSLSHEDMTERASLYALGALSLSEARAFEEHLAEGCELCASELRSFEEVALQLALSAPEAEPSAGVRDRLLSLVAEKETEPGPAAASEAGLSPLITLRANEGDWYKVSEGIKIKQLFVDKQSGMVTTLVKMKPGTHIPEHHHRGIEQCYVIEGDFQAANQSLGAGDFHCAPAGSVHEPVYTINGALLLIIAPQGYYMLDHG
jgi:predicted ChrR family anti-sigma factor